MIDVHEIIRRSRAGESARKIALATHINRKTVARYVQAATDILKAPDTALTDELILAIKERVQGRSIAGPSDATGELTKHRSRIDAWLHDPKQPLRLTRIHELLQRDNVQASYTTLRRFARSEFGFGETLCTVLMDDPEPAQEAQIDFGLMGEAMFEGTVHKLYALIVTLAHSRYSFVWPSLTQTTKDVIEGLEAAWRFFGGICQRIIPDNMTAVVVDPDPHKPVIGRAFREYAQRREFFVDPARVASPQDKARVENQVPYVRERWFSGETFVSLASCREAAKAWCENVAGLRIHGTTRKRPREVYEAVERPLMKPAPTELYEVARWTSAKVQRDHHFQVDKALYSVPTEHIGKDIEVRIGACTVLAYVGDRVVASHPRMAAGERSTVVEHYPKNKRRYAARSTSGLLDDALAHGRHVRAFAERLLEGPYAWTKMRQVTSLLSLCTRYGSARVDRACESALCFDVVNVQRVGDVVTSAAKLERSAQREGKLVALPSRFARPAEAFATQGRATSPSAPGGDA